MNAHDQAREFLATDGIKLSDTQKKAVFEYADWLHQKDTAAWLKQHNKETQERIAYLEKQLELVTELDAERAALTPAREPEKRGHDENE